MSETAFLEVGGRASTSSNLGIRDWVSLIPEQLIQRGYQQHLDFVPTLAQSHALAETKNDDDMSRQYLLSTAITKNGDDMSGQYLLSTAIQPGSQLVIHLPSLDPMPQVPHSVTMLALQEWEGYVVEKGENEFSARLSDITAASLAKRTDWDDMEEAVIPLTEISEDDLWRLRPGSVFRWIIGYEWSVSGTKRRVSQIVFRNLPAMTEQDRTEGSEWARKVLQAIKQ